VPHFGVVCRNRVLPRAGVNEVSFTTLRAKPCSRVGQQIDLWLTDRVVDEVHSSVNS
jgi:hypothetical protein